MNCFLSSAMRMSTLTWDTKIDASDVFVGGQWKCPHQSVNRGRKKIIFLLASLDLH